MNIMINGVLMIACLWYKEWLIFYTYTVLHPEVFAREGTTVFFKILGGAPCSVGV